MDAQGWTKLSRLLFVVAFVAAIGSQATWGLCVWETGSSLNKEFSEADVSPLATRVRTIRADFAARDQAIPQSTLSAAGPICRAEYPIKSGIIYLLSALIAFLMSLFCRNQSKLVRDKDYNARVARTNEPTAMFEVNTRPKLDIPELEDILPDSIEIEGGLDLGLNNIDETVRAEEGDSLMSFVEERRLVEESSQDQAVEAEEIAAQVGGFYCPEFFSDKPVLYVDSKSEGALDEVSAMVNPFNNPQRPFKTLDAAIKYAQQRVIKDTPAIQIRLAPGVYQVSVTIPDRVALINHRMPAEGTYHQRLAWVTGQDLDAPDRVTLFPPASATHAVKFAGGMNQGVYGCHLIGRDTAPQVGILGSGSSRASIFNCVIEGFRKGGIRLDKCALQGLGVSVVASQLFDNTAARGGGIHAVESILSIRDCMIQQNKANAGGGVWVESMKAPVIIRSTRFSKNIAKGPDPGDLRPELVKFTEWIDLQGLGGALVAHKCKVKIFGSEFVENRSNVAGGAVAVLGSLAVMTEDDANKIRFVRNESRLGGAIFVLGWNGGKAVLKLDNGEVSKNRAMNAGGAISGFGLATLQLMDTKISENSTKRSRSLGGGVAVQNGAEFLCKNTLITRNSSKGSGGGLGANNGSLRVGDGSEVRDNSAAECGGGVYLVTVANSEVEDQVSQFDFKLPFALSTRDCMVDGNTSEDLGAGIYVGNMEKLSTFPIAVNIDGKTRLRNNRTKHPNAAGDDLWVLWNQETLASGENRPQKKMLLQ